VIAAGDVLVEVLDDGLRVEQLAVGSGRHGQVFEEGNGGGQNYTVFLRDTDGSPPARIGDGMPVAISPDNKWVVTKPAKAGQLSLVPTGAGESRQLTHDSVSYRSMRFLPDGKHLLSSSWDSTVRLWDLATGSSRDQAVKSTRSTNPTVRRNSAYPRVASRDMRVRIVAPIPGKAAVGIEVPNKTREKVFLKEIVADEAFTKGRAKLPMAIGKDIEGGPSVVDLARMPHLLVAGTTGSGKSVAVNAFITSLLYHASPEDVRMIMVDPKMLELSIYEGIPHLLLPVVTDPKKANLALRWAVEEMDRRYDLLAQMGVRDIATYNDKVGKQLAKLEADKLRAAAEAAARAIEDDIGKAMSADTPEEADARERIVTAPPHRLPYIVVVIDEFADLMMCAPKEVETSVARIAQKARASGIHLILATQRPSVDVITGLIKANFPSRIAFSVASKIDSRTILDQSGAEALLGAGDMLFSDRGAAPVRLHGCYVDEEEIHRVVAFLKTQGRPVYNLDILKPRDEEGEGEAPNGAPSGKSDDDMYDKAVYIVTTTRNASISWVQRQLRIGYNRAARLVEEMEKQGVVSPPDHTNKREVLVAQA